MGWNEQMADATTVRTTNAQMPSVNLFAASFPLFTFRLGLELNKHCRVKIAIDRDRSGCLAQLRR